MKQILIAAGRIGACHLAKKIAEDNPDIEVHLLGPRIKSNTPNNFKWIGEETSGNGLIKKIYKIHSSYDFIYANEVFIQADADFQEWKKTCSVPIFCSKKEISFLEFSKLSTKKILKRLSIPNAEYEEIVIDDWGRIVDFKDEYFKTNKFALKMDKSLVCTGYQTIITSNDKYANQVGVFESFAGSFFAEKFIEGKEFSAHFLCNGSKFVYLGSARDYKKQYENDQGPNTGSTGCYSPVEYITEKIESQIFDYADRILKYIEQEGIEYRGIMYLGCIIDNNDVVNILEINTRIGNPEFCTISSTIQTNLLEHLYSTTVGDKILPITFNDRAAVSINLIHKNYSHFPLSFAKPAQLLDDGLFTTIMFHPMQAKYNYFANLTRVSDSVENSSKEIMSYLNRCDLGDYRYRKDIGKKTCIE